MLYLYDNAIVEDLIKSFNPENIPNPAVSVIGKEGFLDIAAQVQNDDIHFPIVCVVRDTDTPIDSNRMNFTRAHRGVANVLDPETHELYYEKVLPIKLGYTLCVYATNEADMDEMVRELLFKYLDMYFLTIKLPYESDRNIRFAISIDPDTEITSDSSTSEYLKSGKIYEKDIHLRCEGCVLVNYTSAKLKRIEWQTELH